MYMVSRIRGGWGVLAAVIGAAGFVLSWIPFIGIAIGYILGLVAIATGVAGLVRPGSKGLALAGIGLGIVTLMFKSIPIIRWL
jgi:hypothetical protein